MLNLKSSEKFTLKDRGEVYIVSLQENSLPTLREDIFRTLFAKDVIIDNVALRVLGIEFLAIGKNNYHTNIGLLT